MHILAELAPLNPAGGTRVTLRACNAQDRRITALNDQRWWPAISSSPTFAIQLFDGDFTSAVVPGSASFVLQMDPLAKQDPAARGYLWQGADVTFYSGNAGDAWPWTTRFVGVITRYEAQGDTLRVTAEVKTSTFEKDVLSSTYAGTTGIEGGADLKGKPKPWLLGRCFNVEPILINSVDSVFQVSAYGPIEAVNALYERGASFGASIGDYANYAALVAATIPAGRWATCLASGLIRLGAPPYGVITADVDGDKFGGTWRRRTGEIITRIATGAGISSGDLDATSLTALDTALSTLPNVGRIGIYLTEQITVLELARDLALPCNAQAGVSWTGKLFVVRVSTSSPTFTLDAQGRQLPAVSRSIESDVSPPYKRIVMGAARSWRVHSFDEIAFDAELVERGQYDAATVYRNGNIVSLASGARYLYINDTPSSGNMPPNPTYWAAYGTGPTRNVNRGDWTAGTAYVVGDYVFYNGASYDVIADHTASGGSPPPNANLALRASSVIDIILSNPAASVTTDADGANGDFTAALGTLKVMYGGADVTAASTLSEVSETNCTGDVNTATNTPVAGQPKGYYRVTAISAASATYRVRAVYNPGGGNITIEKDFTLSRVKGAASVEVTADRAQINYSIVTGAVTPSTQTTNFTAAPLGSAATITWKVFNEAGVEQTPTSSFLSNVTGLTTAMTASQFNSAVGAGNYIYVRAYVGNVLAPLAIGSVNLRKYVVPEPRWWTLGPRSSNVRTDGTGALDPPTQTTVITAEFTALAAGATITWTLFDGAGNARTPLATYATVSGAGNVTLSMSGSQFLSCANGTGKVRAVATLSGSGTAYDGTSLEAQILEVGDGASAIGLTIKKSRDAITYNGQGFIWPASQSIDFTAVRQNLPTGTVTFEVRDGANNLKTPLATYGTVVGDVLTMSETQFELARGQTQTVQVRAYIGSSEGFATVSGTPLPTAGYNEWPDPLLNTLDRNFVGGAMAAPFAVLSNGDTNGWKYKNYVRVLSTTSPTTEYFHKVTDKIPVRKDGERFWAGFSGGVGQGSGALMFGIYVLFRNLAGTQVGSTTRIGTSNTFTPASNGNWPEIVGAPVDAPAGAAFVEVGWWRDDHGVITSSQAHGVTPYIQRTQPGADQTRGAFPSIAPVMAEPSGTVILNADWKGLGLASAYRFKYSRSFGGVDVSSSTTWTVVKAMGCSAVINSSGLLTVTPVGSSFDPAGFQVRLESTYDGVTESKVLRCQIEFAPPPQTTAASTIVVGAFSAFDLTATSYASETVIAGPTIITSGAAGTIALRAALIVSADAFGAGSASFNCKAQYRPAAGGAWTDAGSISLGLSAEDADNFNLRGAGLYTGASGLTASTDYEWRIIAYKTTAGHIYGQPKLFALNSGTLL